MLELFLSFLAGVVAGTITGIVPGIHVNLIAAILISLAFKPYSLSLAIFIVSMSITHTFLDFLPSIFLGAPDEDTALSILPGHKMLLKGNGYGALRLTAIGSLLGLFLAMILLPFFIFFSSHLYGFIRKFMGYILIFISTVLILKERKKFFALFIFLISGILGLITLNFPLIKQPLLPLLNGLFGTSLLTISFIQKVKIPKQKLKKERISKKETIKALSSSVFSSTLVSFLPGIGASQAAVISSSFWKRINEKMFLVMLGSINTIVMALSFSVLYTVGKSRTGSAAAIQRVLPTITSKEFITLVLFMILSGILSFFLCDFFGRFFARKITRINYRWLCFSILMLIFIITATISGPLALLVLVCGTSIGILTHCLGIRKMHMMGCLLVPTIINTLS